MFQVVRGSAGNKPDSRDVSSALALAEILRDAQEHTDPEMRQRARKLWLKASGLGPGRRQHKHARLIHERCEQVLNARDGSKRAEEVTDLLDDMGMATKLADLNEMLGRSCPLEGAGTREKDRTITLPVERPLSKEDCLIIIDAALTVGEWPGFKDHDDFVPGDRLKQFLKRRK